jgi:hypothetical protein
MVFPNLGNHLEAFERAFLIFTTTHGPNDTLQQTFWAFLVGSLTTHRYLAPDVSTSWLRSYA